MIDSPPPASPLPLAGYRVLEIGGGAAAAYCGRLLVDAGATVLRSAACEDARDRGVIRADTALERAYASYLSAGKQAEAAGSEVIARLSEQVDLVLVGEDAGVEALPKGRLGTVFLSWFGSQGDYKDWQGSELLIQGLTGLPKIAGPVDGPPMAGAERQATMVAGATAYIATCALLLASLRAPRARPSVLEVSVLESNLALQEIQFHFLEREVTPIRRFGVNRFWPQGPMGIYPCRTGWVGITLTTPDQWRSFCAAVGMQDCLEDPQLATREQRFARLPEVEARMVQALSSHDAPHWGAVGRKLRIPIVEVPDAAGILAHPIFNERQSLASMEIDGRDVKLPRAPFGLEGTPLSTRIPLADPGGAPQIPAASADIGDTSGPLLGGLRIVDFTMGWAGPLATRILADLGAEVIKIEAGRYPDWWRGVNWTPEFIANRMYEKSHTFTAMNRGKHGVSIDLTQPEIGRASCRERV